MPSTSEKSFLTVGRRVWRWKSNNFVGHVFFNSDEIWLFTGWSDNICFVVFSRRGRVHRAVTVWERVDWPANCKKKKTGPTAGRVRQTALGKVSCYLPRVMFTAFAVPWRDIPSESINRSIVYQSRSRGTGDHRSPGQRITSPAGTPFRFAPMLVPTSKRSTSPADACRFLSVPPTDDIDGNG